MGTTDRARADADDAVIRAEMARGELERARESLDDRRLALERTRAKAQARRAQQAALEPEPEA
jgi:hypothetical protein